jgi:rare lipoprotein A
MKGILTVLMLCTIAYSGDSVGSGRIHRPGCRLGTASWYGKGLEGHRMANGAAFNPSKYTAASSIYRLGTYLSVTYPATGITVYVYVTDRGPMHRTIDLSEHAAKTLGLRQHGIGVVYICRQMK